LLFYKELKAIADRKGVQLKFEGTVLSGTPAIQFALKELAGCEIIEIRGIVNGNTNYILTKMAEGIPYEEALKEAQKKEMLKQIPRLNPNLSIITTHSTMWMGLSMDLYSQRIILAMFS